MTERPSVFKLVPTTQQYDWGKVGKSSKVAQFAAASQIPGFTIDEGMPYAELWMGTHPKSPSRVRSSNEILSEHLTAQSELIGTQVIEKFDCADGNLPFLFKVLSIEKALSIQTHPDKETAEILHAQQPDIYKDPNHKPEMALAITPFRALCGFRPLPDIAKYLNSTPEFKSLIPPLIADDFSSLSDSANPTDPQEKITLKNFFVALMTAPEEEVKSKLLALVTRYKNGRVNKGEDDDVVQLVLRLDGQFPGDVGIFCAFMLNYVHMSPGEAIFLGAGEPHAYISGDCMECMANSDNVIRAGLTPKLRDVPNLVSGLTYIASPPTKHLVIPHSFRFPASPLSSTLYDPPIPEFSVVQTKISSEKTEAHPPLGGPSIVIVTEGNGQVKWVQEKANKDTEKETLEIGLGDVFFIGAAIGVEFVNSDKDGLVLYRAFVETE
ncbi:mannose-6-phosphate isomerase [Gymnopilus junonius]|uniref:Mannose-6-phosphate isomerase n=1 Tax=Gymnopilus junonius TaxID=109634 RepID=A0A9P5NP67_GYMJU|nr:mannose-6-phosphate isomerase [Gymnopilus junonius]